MATSPLSRPVRFTVASVRRWATVAFLGGLLVGLLAAIAVLAI